MASSRVTSWAVLGVLGLAWLALMWFFNLFDSFWWSVVSVVVAILVLLWASARSREPEDDDA